MKNYKTINGVKWYNVSGSCISTLEYPKWMPEDVYEKEVAMYQEFEFRGGKAEFLKGLYEKK